MKAFAIVLRDHPISEKGWKILETTHKQVGNEFEIERFAACGTLDANTRINLQEVRWNYPWQGEEFDLVSGLQKRAYPTNNPLARVGCFFSHYDLWKKCVALNEIILVLEHDAVFVEKMDLNMPKEPAAFVVGINSPLGATRRARDYDAAVQSRDEDIQPVPRIDSPIVPQGLAGNSAYLISPKAASAILNKVVTLGAWPNDALLCYQNFDFLFQTKKYYTAVNNIGSTTSQ